MKNNKATLSSLDPEPAIADTPKGGEAAESSARENSSSSKDSSSNAAKDAAKDAAQEAAKNAAETTASSDADASASASAQSAPSKPPRPPRRPSIERRPSDFSRNLSELQQAFPDNDENLLRAILVAGGNSLEAAFTGMLALSDKTIRPAEYVRSQISRDEELARRIAISDQQRQQQRQQRRRAPPPRSRMQDYYDEEPDRRRDSEGSFNSEVYDGLQKGYNETKEAVTSLWGQFKQRLNGEMNDDEPEQVFRRRRGNNQAANNGGRSSWWPQQQDGSGSGGGSSSFVSTEAHENAATPRLPQRRRPDDAPKEPKSVNAFGDEINASAKSEEPEPDAFFIGESDDDDLGSLDEPLPAKDKTETKEEKPKEEKPKEAKDKTDTKEEESKEAKKDSAKDLLNKVKSTNEKK